MAARQLKTEPLPAERFTFHVSRFTHHASRFTFHERGVALVITLVLLSVITFMAVTFLVVSRSQHGSVATETDQQVARFAADTARERAIAQLVTPILASTNEFNYGLLVSTNYISPAGFINGLSSPTNVGYNYPNGSPISTFGDYLQNQANLLYDARAPVFIVTNAFMPNSNDFRFYLDLNRNGQYDPSGLQPEIVKDASGTLHFYDLNGNYVPYQWPPSANITIRSNFFMGDPEWIGVLRRPEFAHSADNPFVYRYAYFVVPASQTLDLNSIHNQARNPGKITLNPQGADFLRDQGVGTFEINLASFLYDLNTNYWGTSGYTYDPVGGFCSGTAFKDAGNLLAYRYAATPSLNYTLASVSQLFNNGLAVFGRDFVDGYSSGPVMTGTWWPQPPPPPGSPDNDSARVGKPWAGADNPNHFYSTQDLFDKSKTAIGISSATFSFTDRLIAAGTNTDSYNRYTFYRLESQLGTDSAPEPGGKMHVNYCNIDANGYVAPNMATNFQAWYPAQFFTNAAIRLLVDAGYAVGDHYSTSNILVATRVGGVGGILVTNLGIPIGSNSLYTPSVHRLLQLAANMYDATTNRTFNVPGATNGFPTVFRPLFMDLGGGRVFIIGYDEPTSAEMTAQVNAMLNTPGNPTLLPIDLSDPTETRSVLLRSMVYGIPLVIGAKKGLPNFNEFAMYSQVQVTRKLQFRRPGTSTTAPVNEIDQMFVAGISNVLGVEAWNSYKTASPLNLQLVVLPDITVTVTNLETGNRLRYSRFQPLVATNITANAWAGYNPRLPQYSFQVPLLTNLVFLSNMTYNAGSDTFTKLTGTFERNSGTNFHLPHWGLNMRTRLQVVLFDSVASRIVDYVNLAADTNLDIAVALTSGGACGTTYAPDGGNNGSMWCTNRMYGVNADNVATYGIQNQIEASQGHITVDWNSSTHEFPSGMSVSDAIVFFKGQFQPGYLRSSNTFAAPYQPFRNIYLVTSWQANDPLVHYTAGDLVNPWTPTFMADALNPAPAANLGQINKRYEPWGGSPTGDSASLTKTDLTVKDPLVFTSDNWDFPTNKLPNVGWLGRVHRGTPWQTVYLKSFGTNDYGNYVNWFKKWQSWSGNGQVLRNIGQLSTNLVSLYNIAPDAFFAQPTNDWHLLDLFTTALSENATRGQLSVNQTNLAAWSAVLGGVLVLTNNLTASGSPIFDVNGNPLLTAIPIQPAGIYNPLNQTNWPPMVRLVNGINVARSNSNPSHVFRRLSDILSVPELTMASPFLNTVGLPSPNNVPNGGLNDAAYERLPQQIAGLLKCDSVPRFVIYSFGQTLKPESTRAIVKSGPFAGLCTNYQVVAESATRTVVRFEGVDPNHGTNAITSLHPVIESFNVLPPD
jgi:hypothetical protein